MFRWGLLEGAMLKALGDTTAAPAIVQRWQAAFPPTPDVLEALSRSAEVRHLLAHGLCGAQAQPSDGSAAKVICRTTDGLNVTLTLGQLHSTAQELDLLRLSLRS